MSSSGPSPIARILILPIRFYQRFISRYTPPTCRYYPCCSNYAITALAEHGAIRGSWLTARRLLRCNPWSSGGVDHVPPRRAKRDAAGTPVLNKPAQPAMAGAPTAGSSAA